jgi:hypothetical protein
MLAQTPGFNVIPEPTKDKQVTAGATYEIELVPNSNWTDTVTIPLLRSAS